MQAEKNDAPAHLRRRKRAPWGLLAVLVLVLAGGWVFVSHFANQMPPTFTEFLQSVRFNGKPVFGSDAPPPAPAFAPAQVTAPAPGSAPAAPTHYEFQEETVKSIQLGKPAEKK
jgi:hypothetical protein